MENLEINLWRKSAKIPLCLPSPPPQGLTLPPLSSKGLTLLPPPSPACFPSKKIFKPNRVGEIDNSWRGREKQIFGRENCIFSLNTIVSRYRRIPWNRCTEIYVNHVICLCSFLYWLYRIWFFFYKILGQVNSVSENIAFVSTLENCSNLHISYSFKITIFNYFKVLFCWNLISSKLSITFWK